MSSALELKPEHAKNTSMSTNSPADVADRVRGLQLGSAERKTAEFGLRGVMWLLLISLVAAGVWWIMQQDASLAANVRSWIPGGKVHWEIVSVKVEGGEEVLLDLTGYITPKNKINVTTHVPGTLEELNFEEGQRVEAGQVLAKLDSDTFEADYEQALAALVAAESRLLEMKNGSLPEELEQARTALDQAKDKLKLTERNHARMKKLRQDISDAEWDQSESTFSDAQANVKTLAHKLKLMENGPRAERMRVAEAEVVQSKAMVAKAKSNLDHATLTSPISGIVLERHGQVGENIRPDALASGVYVLADLSQLDVQVDVEEQSLGKLKVGQPCRIIPDAYSDKTYAAKISRWQPQVNRARAVVRVILTITEPDELLLAEMNCRAVILASAETPEPETYWIPTTAAITEGAETKVFVVEENAARSRVVTLGPTKDNQVQVLSGLSKTDRVILPGEKPPVDGQKAQ